MNGKSHSAKKQGAGTTAGSSSKGAIILGAVGVVGLIVAVAVFNSGSPARTATPNANSPTAVTHPNDGPSGSEPNPGQETRVRGAVDPTQDSTHDPKKVVFDIVSVASLTNEVTADDARKFHEGLTELVRQGAASVPAIQDYLDKNLDSNYGNVKGAEELGYSSLRHALLDTLKEIGGPEAEGAMVHVLQTTAEPNEVGELAKDLEQQAPGQYRDQILEAAKEALELAQSGQLGKDIERGPLYRVFQMYNATPPGGQPPPTEPEQPDTQPSGEHANASANPPQQTVQ